MKYLVAYTLSPAEVAKIRRVLSSVEITPKNMPLHVTLIAPGEALLDTIDAIHNFQFLKTIEPVTAEATRLISLGATNRPALAIELRMKPDPAVLHQKVLALAAHWQDSGTRAYRTFVPHVTLWRGAKHDAISAIQKRMSNPAKLIDLRLRIGTLDLYAKSSPSSHWSNRERKPGSIMTYATQFICNKNDKYLMFYTNAAQLNQKIPHAPAAVFWKTNNNSKHYQKTSKTC